MERRGRLLSIALCFFVLITFFPSAPASAAFYDVNQDYWAYPYITLLESYGFSQGDETGAYAPESKVTHAEFTAFLCRISGMDDKKLDSGGGYWADAAMEYALYMGWYTEDEIPRENYDIPITRELASKLVVRGLFPELDPAGYTAEELQITDIADISENYLAYVAQAYSMGILTGYPDGSFRPRDSILRSEAAALLCRAFTLRNNAPVTGESRTVPILMYHHISYAEGLTSPIKFREDMELLLQAGYTTVFLDDLYDFVISGKALPQKPIVITFDDGYLSNYMYAYPVIRELRLKAEIAVIGWSVGVTDHDEYESMIPHFDWMCAKGMVNSGSIRIRSHSYNMHEYSPTGEVRRYGVLKCADESYKDYIATFIEDAETMGELMRNVLGYEPTVFMYPYGAHTILTEKLLESLGYNITVTTEPGINTVTQGDASSLRLLKRIDADGYDGNIVLLIESYK